MAQLSAFKSGRSVKSKSPLPLFTSSRLELTRAHGWRLLSAASCCSGRRAALLPSGQSQIAKHKSNRRSITRQTARLILQHDLSLQVVQWSVRALTLYPVTISGFDSNSPLIDENKPITKMKITRVSMLSSPLLQVECCFVFH